MIKQIEAYEPYNEQEKRDKEIILSMLTEAERMGEDIFSRENRMAHMTASAWVVNCERTKVLLAYHNIYDSWAWLGGTCGRREDLLSVASVRSVRKAALLPHMCAPHGLYRREAIRRREVQETFFRLRCLQWTDTLKRVNTFLRICI